MAVMDDQQPPPPPPAQSQRARRSSKAGLTAEPPVDSVSSPVKRRRRQSVARSPSPVESPALNSPPLDTLALSGQPVDNACVFCGKSAVNEHGQRDVLISCSKCERQYHPGCLELTEEMVQNITKYPWECNDCKGCLVCKTATASDPDLLLCDSCDRGYHFYCLKPPLAELPSEQWRCDICEGSGRVGPRSVTLPMCPVKGCLGTGHVNGRAKMHYSVRNCPLASAEDQQLYANVTFDPRHSLRQIERRSSSLPPGSPSPSSKQRTAPPISSPLASNSNGTLRRPKRNIPPPAVTADAELPRSPKKTQSRPARTTGNVENKSADSKGKQPRMTPSLPPEPVEQLEEEFFGGRLTREEASTHRTTLLDSDKEMFDQAMEEAKALAPPCRSIATSLTQTDDGEVVLPRIEEIVMGKYKIKTWYMAPYPEEYNLHPTIFLCDFCLKYIKSAFVMERHLLKCPQRHPPGDEIYRDGAVSVFEVDGRKNKIYCQNLCLLAKMFLDHKTLYYDVEPFLFYVMAEVDETGCHFVGYFSKEKRSSAEHNLSCIVTLPVFQGKGYGQFLIDFSYLLSRKEERPGSPEKPLSDLGLLTYRSYWRNTILRLLDEHRDTAILSIKDMSTMTGMTVDDVVTTLQDLSMLVTDGQGRYAVQVVQTVLQAHRQKNAGRPMLRASADNLHWSPFVLSKR